jgi:acyl carrier protein
MSQAQPAVPASFRNRDDVISALREDVARLSEGKLSAEEIDPSGHLFDFGYLSSLTAVVFLTQVEERYDIEIEDLALLEDLTTLDAVADRICGAA